MHGSDRGPDLKRIASEPFGWESKTFNESEMALFSECMQKCGKKGLTAPALLEMRFIASHDCDFSQYLAVISWSILVQVHSSSIVRGRCSFLQEPVV